MAKQYSVAIARHFIEFVSKLQKCHCERSRPVGRARQSFIFTVIARLLRRAIYPDASGLLAMTVLRQSILSDGQFISNSLAIIIQQVSLLWY